MTDQLSTPAPALAAPPPSLQTTEDTKRELRDLRDALLSNRSFDPFVGFTIDHALRNIEQLERVAHLVGHSKTSLAEKVRKILREG